MTKARTVFSGSILSSKKARIGPSLNFQLFVTKCTSTPQITAPTDTAAKKATNEISTRFSSAPKRVVCLLVPVT
jgi:hypothetical protein